MSFWTVRFRKKWQVVEQGAPTPVTSPAFTTPPVISGTPAVGQTLTGTNGVASGSPTYTRQWRRDGVNISGATALTYVVQAADQGTTLSLSVTASNSGGTAVLFSNNLSVPTAPSAPVFSVAPTITGTPTEGQTLTATTGTASGSPSYALQWKRNGTNISGATGTTYQLAGADVGTTITVTSTATNGGGSASSTSAATATVQSAGGASGFPSTVNSSLPAPQLELSGASTSYPPQFGITETVALIVGDVLWIERSNDAAGTTGLVYYSHTLTDADLAGAQPYNLDFGLSAITSGDYFYSIAAQRGSERGVLSPRIAHGAGTVAATITNTNIASGQQFIAGSKALTANQTVTWTVVGGADQANFSITGSTLNWTAFATTGAKTVIVRAANGFGITADQTITLTVAANTASAFTFTDASGVALSSTQTSNTITVAGITTAPVPVTITGGTYSKNGGAYTSAVGTASNGDTFAVRVTASGSYVTASDATLTIGSTSDTYSVTTMADPAQPAGWATSTGSNKHSSVSISGATNNVLTQSTYPGIAHGARAVPASATGDDIEFSATVSGLSSQDPIYIGVDNGTVDLSSFTGNPAAAAKTAFLNPFSGGAGTTQIDILGDAYAIYQVPASGQPSGGLQNGDTIIVRVKKSTGAVRFFHKRGAAAETQIGTTATLSGMSAWYARIATAQPSVFTANFNLWGVP